MGAPASFNESAALRREMEETRQDNARTRQLLHEVNARLREGEVVGWTLVRLARRWGVSKDAARGIVRASGVKGRRIGARTLWDVADLPALDAAMRASAPKERGA